MNQCASQFPAVWGTAPIRAWFACAAVYGFCTCTIDRLCNLLECHISDIMEHIPDDIFF